MKLKSMHEKIIIFYLSWPTEMQHTQREPQKLKFSIWPQSYTLCYHVTKNWVFDGPTDDVGCFVVVNMTCCILLALKFGYHEQQHTLH